MSPHATGQNIRSRIIGDRRALWQRRWFRWGIIALVWTVLALFFTGQVYWTAKLGERPESWARVASQQFIYPYIWALLTPAVFWLAGRFPIDHRHWLRHSLLHLLFASLCAIIVSAAFHIIYFLLFAEEGRAYSALMTLRWITNNSSENLGIYGLILLLEHAFSYYRRYREGELRASQLEAQLAQAQLQALKMQLHPHFLFNTLHSISALVHQDTEAADKMIARLGDFLRLTLENSGTQEVTLQQELEFLMCYLEIERVRFHDRLTTHLDIEPQALDARVPNLILQPIVENAIRHGIAPRSAPGRIEIRAERMNGTLRIRVQDNGPGMAMDLTADNQLKQGVGLANTRARLRQLYGEVHRFELANSPEGGLIVTLEIPAGAPEATAA